MLLRNVISDVNGLRYLVEQLEVQSPLGKRYLLDSGFMNRAEAINTELDLVEQVVGVLQQTPTAAIAKIQFKLMQIRDIQGTLNNLSKQRVLDEIELFELKGFLLLADAIRTSMTEAGMGFLSIPELQSEIELLDPEGKKIPSFYIYDAYSQELARCRKGIKSLKQQLALAEKEASADVDQRAAELESMRQQAQEIEDVIREQISDALLLSSQKFFHVQDAVAKLDILIAKALQARALGFSRPVITQGHTAYRNLFNPQLKAVLDEQGKSYQPIDICLQQAACFITGANMAGKTVVLKTLALSQYLFQFGFYVPAAHAEIQLVDSILISLGDEQSELTGLSSFASEMMQVHQMLKTVKSGNKPLILIDELARTTNPDEGRAIVSAVASILNENRVMSVITTHYSGLTTTCRKLRVKGFIEGKARGVVTQKNINQFIDYSLVEDTSGQVPQEALRIASILGVDREVIEKARMELKSHQADLNEEIKLTTIKNAEE